MQFNKGAVNTPLDFLYFAEPTFKAMVTKGLPPGDPLFASAPTQNVTTPVMFTPIMTPPLASTAANLSPAVPEPSDYMRPPSHIQISLPRPVPLTTSITATIPGHLPLQLPPHIVIPENASLVQDVTNCTKNFLTNHHEIIDLNKRFMLPCGHAEANWSQLLTYYHCSCGAHYYYSFCLNEIVSTSSYWHCPDCNKCVSGNVCAHCNRQSDVADCTVQ